MALPTNDNLMEIEDYMTTAMESMISSSVENTYRQREDEVKYTPSVVLKFEVGGVDDHLQPVLNSSGSIARWYHDVYRGTAVVVVVTERTMNESVHREYVGKCRNTFMDPYNYNQNLVYHEVLAAEPGSSVIIVDDSPNHDITTLQFNLVVSVKPTSWATGSF